MKKLITIYILHIFLIFFKKQIEKQNEKAEMEKERQD